MKYVNWTWILIAAGLTISGCVTQPPTRLSIDDPLTINVPSESCEIMALYSKGDRYDIRLAVTNPVGRSVDVYDVSWEWDGERKADGKLKPKLTLNQDASIQFDGEPTSIAGWFTAVAADSSNQSRNEIVATRLEFDRSSRSSIRQLSKVLPGQPDSIAISPYRGVLLAAIEAEDDVDSPGGIWYSALMSPPSSRYPYSRSLWFEENPTYENRFGLVSGLEDLVSEPIGEIEPEFVAFDPRGDFAAVTLQENDAVVFVDVRPVWREARERTFGVPKLAGILRLDEGDEPDGIAVIDNVRSPNKRKIGSMIAIACEGRTNEQGELLGNALTLAWVDEDRLDKPQLVAKVRLPELIDADQPNKRADPEGVALARFGNRILCFVGIERADLLMIFDVTEPREPKLIGSVPTGSRPEGVITINHSWPSNPLLWIVTANEGEPGTLTFVRLRGE